MKPKDKLYDEIKIINFKFIYFFSSFSFEVIICKGFNLESLVKSKKC